jgi:peptide/nickel transport system permease protein
MLHIIPGDPVVAMLGAEATQEQIDTLRHELWLDRPMLAQYGHWLFNVLHGNFGRSLVFHENVTKLVMERLPVTLYLSMWAFLLAATLGISSGIISAVRRGKWIDSVVTVMANIGVATPVFWLGILGIYFLGLQWSILPIQGYTSPMVDFGLSTKKAIMPVICLSVLFMATLARQTRSSMLEVVRQDYIRTAKAKGLSERTVIFKHALKNAFIPIVTLVGLQIRALVGGSVLVEKVFNIPGMGRLIVDAAFDKDFLIVQAVIMVLSVIICLANLAVDISYGWFDPRIRYE